MGSGGRSPLQKFGGKDFEKGKCPFWPSPGRTPCYDVNDAKKFTTEDCERVLTKFLDWKFKDLIEFAKKGDSPVLEMLIARILIEAARKGDQIRLSFIFDRLLGKQKETVEVQTKVTLHDKILNLIEDNKKAREQAGIIDVTPVKKKKPLNKE